MKEITTAARDLYKKIAELPALKKVLFETAAEFHANDDSIPLMISQMETVPGAETLPGAEQFCATLTPDEYEAVTSGIHDERCEADPDLEDPTHVVRTMFTDRPGHADFLVWSEGMDSCY